MELDHCKVPRAWDGKAEARCTIRVNYPGENSQRLPVVATFPFLVPTLRRPGAARGLSPVFRGSPGPRDAVLLRGECLPTPKDRRCSQTRWSFAVTFKARCSPLLPVRPCGRSFGNHSVCRVPRVAGAAGGSEGSCAAVGERVCSFLWRTQRFQPFLGALAVESKRSRGWGAGYPCHPRLRMWLRDVEPLLSRGFE